MKKEFQLQTAEDYIHKNYQFLYPSKIFQSSYVARITHIEAGTVSLSFIKGNTTKKLHVYSKSTKIFKCKIHKAKKLATRHHKQHPKVSVFVSKKYQTNQLKIGDIVFCFLGVYRGHKKSRIKNTLIQFFVPADIRLQLDPKFTDIYLQSQYFLQMDNKGFQKVWSTTMNKPISAALICLKEQLPGFINFSQEAIDEVLLNSGIFYSLGGVTLKLFRVEPKFSSHKIRGIDINPINFEQENNLLELQKVL